MRLTGTHVFCAMAATRRRPPVPVDASAVRVAISMGRGCLDLVLTVRVHILEHDRFSGDEGHCRHVLGLCSPGVRGMLTTTAAAKGRNVPRHLRSPVDRRPTGRHPLPDLPPWSAAPSPFLLQSGSLLRSPNSNPPGSPVLVPLGGRCDRGLAGPWGPWRRAEGSGPDARLPVACCSVSLEPAPGARHVPPTGGPPTGCRPRPPNGQP